MERPPSGRADVRIALAHEFVETFELAMAGKPDQGYSGNHFKRSDAKP
jgi:hypothetical protein